MCSSQHLLFKSDRTDKDMTLVGKSRIIMKFRCSLLAESTVQIIKDQKGCECNQQDNWCPMVSYAAGGTVSALSFWQTHALSLRRYIDTEPLKKGL